MEGLVGVATAPWPRTVYQVKGLNVSSNPYLEAALQYASRGWRVFPCHGAVTGPAPGTLACTCNKANCTAPAKHPKIREWQKAASTTPQQIQMWWRRWPNANIGLATGRGLVVLDLDGVDEVAAFAAIVKPHGGLPETLVAQTGRGFHIYLAGDWQTTRKVNGLLVRGRGGFVILPPSMHASGRQYQWIKQAPIAPMPDWFKVWLQTPAQTTQTPTGNAGASGGGTAPAPIPDYIRERMQRLAAQGSTRLSHRVLKSFAPQWDSTEETRILAALQAIPADCPRDEWLQVGMALHSLEWIGNEAGDTFAGDRGYQIWLEWSRGGGSKFQGEFDCETRWRSFGKRHGVGIGTLFHYAQARGWQGPGNGAPVSQAVGVAGNSAQGPAPGAGTNGTAYSMPAAWGAGPNSIRWPDTDRFGNPRPTCVNVRKAIEALGLSCGYDTFHERFVVGGRVLEQFAGELSDTTVQLIRMAVYDRFRFDPPTHVAYEAAFQECLAKSFDPLTDYLNGLKWDGVKRLDSWLAAYMGAEATVLNSAIGRLTLIAAVRRAFVPGTKFDQILVLEGPEGRNKSSAVEMLAGTANFSDQSILTVDDRAQQEAVQGVWIYEIADLAGIHRADVERVKAFASRQVDRARPAYGRARVDKPRRCIFFATTNDNMYLKGFTGNRRFWPVQVGHIDLIALKRDRDQLWAEAVEAERTARSLFLDPSLWSAARESQENRREVDPWESLLEHVEGKSVEHIPGEKRVAARDILDLHLRLNAGQMTGGNMKRVASIMAKLGWERVKFRDGEKIVAGYRRAAVI